MSPPIEPEEVGNDEVGVNCKLLSILTSELSWGKISCAKKIVYW